LRVRSSSRGVSFSLSKIGFEQPVQRHPGRYLLVGTGRHLAQTIIETARDETNTELPGTFHMSRYNPFGVSHWE